MSDFFEGLMTRIDSLSSTELYGLIVAVTVVISFSLIGSAPSSADVSSMPDTSELKSTRPKDSGPQPKWFVLKWLNYFFVGAFLLSVANFSLNAQAYLQESTSLLKFLIGWSLFLCYFFGFFGISFVDTDQFVQEEKHDLHKIQTKPKTIHPPTQSAPVCSDPATFKPTPKIGEVKHFDDDYIASLVLDGKMKDHELENKLDPHRAVEVRRIIFDHRLSSLGHQNALQDLPCQPSLDYSRVHGANCEIVVGYVPLPVGIVGPLTLNNQTVYVPMATTEGCLVASTQRGAKAISQGSGATAIILKDGITRAPCIRMESAAEAARLKLWCDKNFHLLKVAFESTTSFGKLKSCNPTVAGRNIYLRLVCFSGDAMGMNMVSKGSLAVIETLREYFPSLQLIALSGNMCTDKKAAATNWLEGRGKSVVVEAIIPEKVVLTTLKTTVKQIVQTNLQKNLVGSAMAGTIGGFNAHAANIVSAVFLATGQDPAQNVESSNCITLLEETETGDLWISCTMPSLEVGTVGGGTTLPAQASCLKAIGVKGSGKKPGDNSQKLAMVVAAATMAGEVSLLAALAANTLVAAHMKHNRKPQQAK
mmetsp:Transcript_6910/g.9903  ORF Transcript_6910/g.9903 Transcript_6910/m.9903 type:complete len:591 (-) Transcript_6910:107-1879(-)